MKNSIDMHNDGSPADILGRLWADAGGASNALAQLQLKMRGPLLPSAYRIEEIATITTAATGLAAARFAHLG